MRNMIISIISFLTLINCTKEEEVKVYVDREIQVEIEKIVTVTNTVTETVNVLIPPEDYGFTRRGKSTVFYTGQTTRLKQATELKSAMNNAASTKTQLDNMFNNGSGFTDSSLDGSKKCGNKTAASPIASATVKPIFDTWITEFAEVVAPAVNSGTTASAGVAGSYTESDGSRTVKVNSKGFEFNQVFSKGLIGALQVDQIINQYLSVGKLDSGTAREDNDNGVYGYALPGETELTITKMEHYWDEGFGYLQGLDNQFVPGLADGGDRAHLNYYLNKINSQGNEDGITKKIYDAFNLGRAAIVAKDYVERDKQAAIIAAELSKVIGYKAFYYIEKGSGYISEGKWAAAHHALSEAYGFILGMQFTKAADGVPYMTNAEVNTMLDALAAGNGFWDRTPVELDDMAAQLKTATGLSSP
ncbi:MAG: DUF4856 domain-containing protein [Bacteroidota bacterium]|nr:DUF4856 domain-containing protein [Bacteroidota bacterium]